MGWGFGGYRVLLLVCCGVLLVNLCESNAAQSAPIAGFRPPAVPLVTMDPFNSIWSMASNLTDDWPRYWDGMVKALVGLIRIDGKSFRFMGPSGESGGTLPPPMQQQSVTVYPTQTVYVFQQNGVELAVTFTTPLLTHNWELLSRPITYITFKLRSVDGAGHMVDLYYDHTAEFCVADVSELVVWERFLTKKLDIMRMGTQAQNILGESGDGVAINWGYVYLAGEASGDMQSVIFGAYEARAQFISSGTLPPKDDTRMPRAANDDWPVSAIAWKSIKVAASGAKVQRYLMVAYDDIYSIKWFGTNFRPYWNRVGAPNAVDLLDTAAGQYLGILQECEGFDRQLIAKLEAAGGAEYATLASLAYRQVLAGSKLVWNPATLSPWYFMKEISSDGDLSTVDVIFPASPLFLHFSPALLRLLLLPILAYANNETSVPYTFPWSPHHLGEYPIGYIKPSDQENMPVEETGNMFLMMLGIVQREGNGTEWLFPKYTRLLQMWADYLLASLPDPGDQLCTDDFEGPTPHDSNLAAKGIVGVAAYAELLAASGNHSGAAYYRTVAARFAKDWARLSFTNYTGKPHYNLRYDKPETWSLKYNIAYQYFLGLSVFPRSVIDTEMSWYFSQMNQYGIPLDNRSTFTKFDWQSWVAAMSLRKADYETIYHRLYLFAHQTPDRVPLSDWYWTLTGRMTGFKARTVVGALYGQLLVQ